MKKKILLLVVTVVVLGLVYSAILAAESIPTRFIEITGNTVNIRTGPSTSTTIVALAKKGDIFELKGEINGWYKINMFSGEYRYVHKSLAKLTTYTISLPSSASIRQEIFNLIGEAEDRAMDEADQKYPMNIPNNIDQNIDYERLLIDKYKLTIFHEFKIQPVIYKELVVEIIKEQQEKKETKKIEVQKYKYAASKKSEVFHYINCFYVASIKPGNLILFKTREEAIASGRRPCKKCKP